MAFDAGMLASSIYEINQTAAGARVEKVYQPEKDTVVLQMRTFAGGKRLLINAGSNNPRIGFSDHPMENPATPPLFCVLLRKHLTGAKLLSVRQPEFERVAILDFETHDEMGFPCEKHLYAEVMGKYSNLIFTDADQKISAVLRPVDFTTSSRRQVLPGMRYEFPPSQDKINPLNETEAEFCTAVAGESPEMRADRFITGRYLGISSAVAREIVYQSTRYPDTPLRYVTPEALWQAFSSVFQRIRQGNYEPTLALLDGKPVEYAFLPLRQYGPKAELISYTTPGQLLDAWFGGKDNEQRVKQRAGDILKLLSSAEARITKKLIAQRQELADCEKGEEYRKQGDLITANIHILKRGQTKAQLTDYEDWHEDGTFGQVWVTLDGRLDPSGNAQAYYKKYTKARNAKTELTRQIELGEAELHYIDTVFDALTHAETPTDLLEIREELYRAGYASKMKGYTASKKTPNPSCMQFRTTNGYKVLCGKNNLQNEYITFRLAGKNDYWFHVKNFPGSHAVLFCNGEEPEAVDFTDAAEIAATYSKPDSDRIEVDYTLVKHVKKPPASRPGYVIYHTNWSCVVTPDETHISAMREK